MPTLHRPLAPSATSCRLWAGQTISVFGSLTTRLALPFTAVVYLDAQRVPGRARHVSSDVLAGICFALFAGVWVDRLRRRPIMIAADLGRALIIGSVPLAARSGRAAHRAALRRRVPRGHPHDVLRCRVPVVSADARSTPEQLVEGNSKLAASASVAEFGSFSVAGWLVQLVTAPGAMAVDAVSFLFSAASLRAIRTPEPPPAPVEDRAQRAGARSSRACARSGTIRASARSPQAAWRWPRQAACSVPCSCCLSRATSASRRACRADLRRRRRHVVRRRRRRGLVPATSRRRRRDDRRADVRRRAACC